MFEAEIKAQYLIINVQTFKFKYAWCFGAYLFGMGGFLQVLSQCCISRRSETYKTGDMGLAKTSECYKIRLNVISFMEEMSVFPSVTLKSLYELHAWTLGEFRQRNY